MCEKSIVNINSNKGIVSMNNDRMINLFISLRTLINLVGTYINIKNV